ncbi:2'-deoxynucleoside 5'-phosphate N-hydrolase 1, partial [Clarias magur]
EDSLPGGDEAIYDRDMEWLPESDVVVAEVTHPSFGVGYEIGQAMVLKKRTLCLFRPSSGKVLPAMIQHAEAKMGSSVFKNSFIPPCDGVVQRGEDALLGGDEAIYGRDMEWLAKSEVVVAEVTQPSLGVGYEIGQAVAMKKRILCLFRPSSGK